MSRIFRPSEWDLRWFNLDWGKRWGLPIVVLAVAIGAFIGTTQWRFSGAYQSLTAPKTTTVTVTPDAPVPPAQGAPQVSVRTVTETVRLTGQAPPPETVVKTEQVTVPGGVETVTKTVEGKTETTTVTITAPPPGGNGLPQLNAGG